MKNIEILRTYQDGVTFVEAMKLCEGKRMLSNLDADAILQDDEQRSEFSSMLPCWTSAFLIYEAPGVPFGEYVKDNATGWIFDVPKKFQGLKDHKIMLEFPDFTIEKGAYDMTFVKTNKLYEPSATPFPQKDGWYLVDGFGIPTGKEVSSSDKNARYLYRRTTASLRPVSRWDGFDGDDGRVVDCDRRPDYGRLGVGVVEPQAKHAKK